MPNPRPPHSAVPVGDGAAARAAFQGTNQETSGGVRINRASRGPGRASQSSSQIEPRPDFRLRRASRSSSLKSVSDYLGASSSESSEREGDHHAVGGRRPTRNRVRGMTAAFTNAYEYEWHDSNFFEGYRPSVHGAWSQVGMAGAAGRAPRPPPPTGGEIGAGGAEEGARTHPIPQLKQGPPNGFPGTAPGKGEPKTPVSLGSIDEMSRMRELEALRPMTLGKLRAKMDRLVLMEVAAGTHQLVEVSATEVMHRVRAHKLDVEALEIPPAVDKDISGLGIESPRKPSERSPKRQTIGELTYRDIRQVFTEGKASPSIEVRRNCIVVCLPPVIALILHDRCVFMVHDDLDTDALLVKLEEITGTYAKRAAETMDYYLREYPSHTKPTRRRPGDIGPKALTMSPSRQMLFGGESIAEELSQQEAEEGPAQVPRYVSFPLEFAMLEVLMSFAFEILQKGTQELEATLQRVEKRVTRKTPNVARLGLLHDMKTPCQEFQDTVSALAEAFRDLLTSPDDMAHMELTRLYFRPEQYSLDADEHAPNANLEILFEFFDQEVSQFDRRVRGLLRTIDNMEKLLTLRMSLTRNAIVYYELAGTIIAVFLGIGTCISGIFGMNVVNSIEESHTSFVIIVIIIAILALIGVALVSGMIIRNKFA